MSTIKNLLFSLQPCALTDATSSVWPPDLFCLAASVLKASGAYVEVLRKWPSEHSARPASEAERWAPWARRIGRQWRDSAGRDQPAPEEVRRHWATIVAQAEVPIDRVSDCPGLCCALLELVSLADEASAGVGISDATQDDFLQKAQALLLAKRDGSASLCTGAISPSVARVLPKQHTPGKGMTLRSLTHHLALHQGNEVVPKWFSVPRASPSAPSINLLLAPWPLVLRPKQFRQASGTLAEMPDGFRFMTLDLGSEQEALEDWIRKLVEESIRHVGRIDGVVFPEMSFLDGDLPAVRKGMSAAAGAFIIAGVVSSGPPSRNSLVFSSNVGASEVEVRQDKHHRWRLDRQQIEMYGLGATLEPTFDWWELTEIGKREVNFLTLDERLTVCCLVCEDLARQDPVAELVRSVGPNLVVALLMDAAQLAVRWPARYATVLADDPGSSVLTLTSAGMVNLARTPPGTIPSRSIALWRDARSGTTEIELPSGAQGIVLSLYLERSREWSADGRQDDPAGASFSPRLGGIHPIFFGKKADSRG